MSETTPFKVAENAPEIHSVEEAEKAIDEFKYHLICHVQWNGKIHMLDTYCFACKKVWVTCIEDGVSADEMKKYLR